MPAIRSGPLGGGMVRSSISTSQGVSARRASVLSPSTAWAATRMPGWLSTMRCSPARTIEWSSAMITWVGRAGVPCVMK